MSDDNKITLLFERWKEMAQDVLECQENLKNKITVYNIMVEALTSYLAKETVLMDNENMAPQIGKIMANINYL